MIHRGRLGLAAAVLIASPALSWAQAPTTAPTTTPALTETLLAITIKDPATAKSAASIPVLGVYPASAQPLPVVVLVTEQAAMPSSRLVTGQTLKAQAQVSPQTGNAEQIPSLHALVPWLTAQGLAVVIPASIQPGLAGAAAAPPDCSPAGVAAWSAHSAGQLFALADLLRQQSWADTRRMVVITEGPGTLASLSAAAMRWPGLRGVVAMTPDVTPPAARIGTQACAQSALQPILSPLDGKVPVPTLTLRTEADSSSALRTPLTRLNQAAAQAEPSQQGLGTAPKPAPSPLMQLTDFLARTGLIAPVRQRPGAADPADTRPLPANSVAPANPLAELSGDRLPQAPKVVGLPDAPKPLSPLLAPRSPSSADGPVTSHAANAPANDANPSAAITAAPLVAKPQLALPQQAVPSNADPRLAVPGAAASQQQAAVTPAMAEQRMPFVATSERAALWQRYQRLASPRALALSPSGAWGLGSGVQARIEALNTCERASGQPCQIFAVNDQIIWKP